jgi:porphobilinogen synthase
MAFPATRMRRLRRTGLLRGMVRETELTPSHLVQPYFVELGTDSRTPIESMPGVDRLSISHLVEEAGRAHEAGVPSVLLFGLPAEKDERASGAYDDEGVVQLAVRALKDAYPELVVITDVCLCEYTSHGHCGVVRTASEASGAHGAQPREGEVDNDLSLELLAKTAISHARAGADAVAPSDMMDGRVAALRAQLDAESLKDTPIISYSAKYASAFYGPFREAADSTPAFGDRRSYQMDPANSDEAVRESLLDVEEGADMLMVKPALAYLDVLHRVKQATNLPVAAYNVSGEYAMLEAAAAAGYLDRRAAITETLTSIRRAGADVVITYWATEAAGWLR